MSFITAGMQAAPPHNAYKGRRHYRGAGGGTALCVAVGRGSGRLWSRSGRNYISNVVQMGDDGQNTRRLPANRLANKRSRLCEPVADHKTRAMQKTVHTDS